jgi:hypothetical protein
VIRCAQVMILVALLAAPALATGPAVGQEAPDTTEGDWIQDPPAVRSVRELRGDVVIVLSWNPGDLQSARSMKPVADLARPEDGVHLLSFVRSADRELIMDRLRAAQIKSLPVNSMGGDAYGSDYVPYVWVVGVDGTIAYAGSISEPKLAETVRDEAKKVRYPGLGRAEFDRGLQKALDKYKRSDLEGARKEAQKVVDDPKAAEAAKADAADLLARLTRIGLGQRRQAEYFEGLTGRQARGLALWEEIAERWKKEPEGVHAKARADALSKDPELAKERTAEKAWRQLEKQLKGKSTDDQRSALMAFVDDQRFRGTMAAREARAVLNALPAPAQQNGPDGNNKR